jgi:predicted transcriptional regulator
LKHAKLLSVFLILLVIVFSLVAVFNLKLNNILSYNFESGLVHSPLVQKMSLSQPSPLLNQSTRLQIYNFITKTPGTNFRGICNTLTLPIGVVQYHLATLMRGGLVCNRRDGRNKRYFESKKFSSTEMKIVSILRHQTVEKILTILRGRLAQRLEISSQALTWQMKRLKEASLVTSSLVDGNGVIYSLDEAFAVTVKQCLNVIADLK